MATQNTASKPLNDDEEEKRKRKVAEDYLKNRSAYTDSLKPGFTVDVPEDVSASMTDEQLKAEGTRRIGEIKTNFQDSFKAANEAGFKDAQAAQDYLNKGQARIVGDTLVGSAAGISASEWDKRDKAVASGNNPPMPKPKQDMVEVAPGVRMGEKTANRYSANLAFQNYLARPTTPDVTPEQAAKNYLANLTETRAKEQADSIARYNNFRNTRENERIVEDQAEKERAAENRNYSDLKSARRAMLKDLRAGKVINPETIQATNDLIRSAEKARGGGGSLDVDKQRKSFISKVGSRVNPFDPSTGPKDDTAGSSTADSATAPAPSPSNNEGFSLGSNFSSLLGDETPEQKKARERLGEISANIKSYNKFYGRA